jgi:periplasmic divalent cation tolerance protein
MTDKIAVLTTCGSEKEARRIARGLVEARLAACVAATPGTVSVYRWKGVLEESAEWSLAIKTRRDLFAAVCAEIRRLHSYETPEIVALQIVDGSPEYLEWMDNELRPAEAE